MVSRRSFLDYLLLFSGLGLLGSVLYPVFKFLTPPKRTGPAVRSVVAAAENELKPNSGKIFKFGSRPGLLVRTSNGEYRAFDGICTHLNCTVQYRDDIQHIWCACHNGHYDLHGKNIAGPPPRPLEEYDVATDESGNVIVARRS